MNRENEKTNPENIQTENVSEEILQNLKDAGCDETTIGCYIGCCGCGQDQVKVLKKHRLFPLRRNGASLSGIS